MVVELEEQANLIKGAIKDEIEKYQTYWIEDELIIPDARVAHRYEEFEDKLDSDIDA